MADKNGGDKTAAKPKKKPVSKPEKPAAPPWAYQVKTPGLATILGDKAPTVFRTNACYRVEFLGGEKGIAFLENQGVKFTPWG